LNLRTSFFLPCLLSLFSLCSYAQTDTAVPVKFIIDQIVLTGNKTTHNTIITRELTLHEGDTLTTYQWEKENQRSRQNLLNTLLFNFVNVSYSIITPLTDAGEIVHQAAVSCVHVIVTFDFKERWYTIPIPIFEFYDQNFNTWWLNKNFDRLDYGLYLSRTNFLGRKQILTLTCRLGYAEQYGITYTLPYINTHQNSGISCGVTYNRTHEIPYMTIGNKFVFYDNSQNHVREDLTARFAYTFRQGFYNTYFADVRFTHAQVADTLRYLTENYFANNQSVMEFFSVNLGFVRDRRDSKAFPLEGYYINLGYNKSGLGILNNESLDIWQIGAIFRKYFNISGRLYGGFAFKGRWSGNSAVPYYLQSTIGFRDYIRGYEYYVIDGQSYGLLKNEIRYQIIKPHVRKIPFVPLEKFNTFHYAFYASLFADLAYVEDKYDQVQQMNTLSNSMLYGYGAGIDFVTYYDIVFRVEYAFNKMGENGFVLHLNSPL
jgi:outer membrane protein assembly factor BamA